MPTATATPGEANAYVVQPGDTLTIIAQQFGTTAEELAKRNGIADPSVIYAGQIIYYRYIFARRQMCIRDRPRRNRRGKRKVRACAGLSSAATPRIRR